VWDFSLKFNTNHLSNIMFINKCNFNYLRFLLIKKDGKRDAYTIYINMFTT